MNKIKTNDNTQKNSLKPDFQPGVSIKQSRNKRPSKKEKVSYDLASSLELAVVLDHILDRTLEVVPTNTCNFMVINGNEGLVIRQHGYEQMGTAEILESRRMDLQKLKSFAKIIQTHEALIIQDTREDADWIPLPESFWVRSFLSMPIVIDDNIYGCINCDHFEPGRFNKNHLERLKKIVREAVIAIKNANAYAEVKRQLNQLSLVTELSQSLLQTNNVEEILRALPAKILDTFDANSIVITKWESEKDQAVPIIAYGAGLMPTVPRVTYNGKISITRQIITSRFPLLVTEDSQFQSWHKELRQIFADPIMLAFPLIAQEQAVGAIFIGFKSPRTFSQSELSLGEFACSQIASILYKSYVYNKAQQKAAQYQHATDLIASLSTAATQIYSAAGLEDIIQTIGSELEKMNIHSLLLMLDSESNSLSLDYCSRISQLTSLLNVLEPSTRDKIVIPVQEGRLFDSTLLQHKLEFIKDPVNLLMSALPARFSPFISKFQDALDLLPDTKSLFLPLTTDQKTIGLLGLYGVNLEEIDLHAGEIFNSQVSAAFEISRLLSEIKNLAITDDLTGIHNRRGLFEIANREMTISRRLNRPFSALMIDIDNFKVVNDRYGHSTGDFVLQEIAARISSSVREIDIVGRYGGEEFVVILIENDINQAILVAERIRKAIAEKKIFTEAGPILVTASVGVSQLTEEITSLDKLINSADQALYSAKHNGRNRVATLQAYNIPDNLG